MSIALTDEDYEQLKELAEEQDRYISGQARHILRDSLRRIAEVGHRNEPWPVSVTPLEAEANSSAAGQPPGPHDNASAKQEPLPG